MFIAKTAFEARITNNAHDALAQVAGKFRVGDDYADCSAGVLVKRKERAESEAFAGVKNENSWIMVAAGAEDSADEVIYACDSHGWPMVSAPNGNRYAVGTETLGLGAHAGEWCNYTRINFDNESVYRFGEGNLAGSLGENTFFTIGEGGLLVPTAAKPTTVGAIYFELADDGKFTAGTTAAFGYIDVVAKKVTVAASGKTTDSSADAPADGNV